jgi:WD40 repeat protein
MRKLLGLLVVLAPAAGLTGGADEPKKPTIDDDRKAIQGVWELVPGKNPEGLSVRLTFEKDRLQIDLKQMNVGLRNDLGGVELAEMGQERFLLVGGSKWPYVLDGDRLSLTMSGPYNGKLLLARVGKQGGPPVLQAKLRDTLKGIGTGVLDVCFRPDGKRLAGASGGQGEKKAGAVTVWDVEAGIPFLDFEEHKARVVRVGYSPDGKRIASASQDGALLVWDANDSKVLRALRGWYQVRFCFNSDGAYLAATSEDGKAKLWHLESGKDVRTIESPNDFRIQHLSFSPDGKRLLTVAESFARKALVQVWEAETGKELLNFQEPIVSPFRHDVCFSPDGQRIAVAFGELKVFDAQTGKLVVTMNSEDWIVESVSFSADGKRLAGLTVNPKKPVLVWDAQTGQQLASLKDDHGAMCVRISPDGNSLALASSSEASGSTRGEVRIWDLAVSQPK